MLEALRRRSVTVVILAFSGGLVWLASGCTTDGQTTESTSTSTTVDLTTTTSSEASDTSATTQSTSAISSTTVPAGPSTTSGPQTVVVGPKTPEEYEKALPDLEKAANANPNDLATLQELALAQYNTRRYQEAATTYLKMLRIKDDAFTRNNYANVLRDWKKLSDAKAQYERAISTDPTLAIAYVNLASLLQTEGKTAEAIKVLDRGIAATTGEDRTGLQDYKKALQATTTS